MENMNVKFNINKRFFFNKKRTAWGNIKKAFFIRLQNVTKST